VKAVIRYKYRNHKEQREFRLVCSELSLQLTNVGQTEVLETDALGGPSWRPCSQPPLGAEQALARALFASQMTAQQRLRNPDQLHPEGVAHVAEGNTARIEIDLGTVTL
jgi:hypothetical protein